MGWVRELRTTGEIPIDVGERMERYFGNSEWANIWSRRVDGEIEPAEAVDQYLHLYANGLRRLGYKTVLDARVRRYGDKGQPLYTLIFATDHEAGRKIMDQILDIVTRNPTQPTLFTRARERRLD
jgi:three-Cys-motif partner protein